MPLSHTELLIQFAFESYFYIVLYFLIGMLSVFDLIVFGLYHRITARPDRGRIAPFRFFSFLKLTVPNAFYGCVLALFPVAIINFFISAAVAGYILDINTNIFQCESNDPTMCQYTIFDLLKDSPQNYNVNYVLLRNGRCAVGMLVSGLYLMICGLKTLIPDTAIKS